MLCANVLLKEFNHLAKCIATHVKVGKVQGKVLANLFLKQFFTDSRDPGP